MTDTEIIERLADFMGWEEFIGKTCCPKCHEWYPTSEYKHWVRKDNKGYSADGEWNPLRSWNNWRDVEMKVMEDKDLLSKYILELKHHCHSTWALLSDHLVQADLPTRCTALLSALDSLK